MDNNSPWLLWNGEKYSLSELAEHSQKSSFFNSSVRFIKEWTSEQNLFTLQTSGSTGTPKQITVTREQLTKSAKGTINFLDLQKGQTALVCLNTEYIAGIMMLVRSLIGELNIILSEPSGSPIPETDEHIHFTALVPLQINTLIRSNKERLSSIDKVIVGGAAISGALEDQMAGLPNEIYQTFGMTETLSHIALKHIGKENTFRVLPNIQISQSEEQCLIVESDYFEKLVTTDIVSLASNKEFIWLGRKDFVINSGGVKLHPEQIESKLVSYLGKDHPYKLMIGHEPDDQLGSRVILLIEHLATWEVLENNLASILSRYEAPKRIYILKKFVYTPTGKINRLATLATNRQLLS